MEQFFGILIGSFFTLLGVYLTNKANDKRLKIQFDHETSIKKENREISLRKDVYLEATETVSIGLLMLIDVSNLDIPSEQLGKSYRERSASINKVLLIAGEELYSSMLNFTNELAKIYLKLQPKRISLMAIKQQADLVESQFTASGIERDKMLELMKKYNIDGENDPHKWSVINKNFEREQNNVHELLEQHKIIVSDLMASHEAFVQECFLAQLEMQRFLPSILFASRKELKISTNEVEIQSLIDKSLNEQKEYAKELLEKIYAEQKKAVGG